MEPSEQTINTEHIQVHKRQPTNTTAIFHYIKTPTKEGESTALSPKTAIEVGDMFCCVSAVHCPTTAISESFQTGSVGRDSYCDKSFSILGAAGLSVLGGRRGGISCQHTPLPLQCCPVRVSGYHRTHPGSSNPAPLLIFPQFGVPLTQTMLPYIFYCYRSSNLTTRLVNFTGKPGWP